MSASISAVDDSAVGDAEEPLRFVRGLLFGMAFSLPIWGVIIAVARLVA